MEDVAEAFEVILRKGCIGETYNIGTQKERTVMDVAHAIINHFNLPMDNIVHVRDRAFNDQRWDLESCCQLPCEFVILTQAAFIGAKRQGFTVLYRHLGSQPLA